MCIFFPNDNFVFIRSHISDLVFCVKHTRLLFVNPSFYMHIICNIELDDERKGSDVHPLEQRYSFSQICIVVILHLNNPFAFLYRLCYSFCFYYGHTRALIHRILLNKTNSTFYYLKLIILLYILYIYVCYLF